MESGYNYQYLYDLLKSEGYNVKVAHPLMESLSRHNARFQMFCLGIPIPQFSGLLYFHKTYSHIHMTLSAGLPSSHLDLGMEPSL